MGVSPAYFGGVASARAPVAPRAYFGNMCGVHVPGLPPVDGGSPDPTLVLSWFYPRYDADSRRRIRDQWHAQHLPDVLLSWPDDRAFGLTRDQHADACGELCADGFQPADMLGSKLYDPQDDGWGTLENIRPVLETLAERDVVSRYCVGFEMNLWNTFESLQVIVDGVSAIVKPQNRPLYVHFSPGYADWRPNVPGSTFADYWNQQVGKLTGLFHQRVQQWSDAEWQARVVDVLERFAGNFGVVPDSGFGHPFDFIELEINADDQYWGRQSEADGDRLAQFILGTPASVGPLGPVPVMGSGNGR